MTSRAPALLLLGGAAFVRVAARAPRLCLSLLRIFIKSPAWVGRGVLRGWRVREPKLDRKAGLATEGPQLQSENGGKTKKCDFATFAGLYEPPCARTPISLSLILQWLGLAGQICQWSVRPSVRPPPAVPRHFLHF